VVLSDRPEIEAGAFGRQTAQLARRQSHRAAPGTGIPPGLSVPDAEEVEPVVLRPGRASPLLGEPTGPRHHGLDRHGLERRLDLREAERTRGHGPAVALLTERAVRHRAPSIVSLSARAGMPLHVCLLGAPTARRFSYDQACWTARDGHAGNF